jgi:hypothetical protein
MKLTATLLGAAAAAALLVPETAVARELCQVLLGGNENPPVVSDGTGRFRSNIRPSGDIAYRLRYDFSDIATEVQQAHLHVANPGNNGGIAAFLCHNLDDGPPGLPACGLTQDDIRGVIREEDVLETMTDGTTVLDAEDLEGLGKLIEDGAVYVNVHTMEHPSGELRCQINARER